MSASSWPTHLVAFALGATAATLVLLTVTEREPTSYAEHSVQPVAAVATRAQAVPTDPLASAPTPPPAARTTASEPAGIGLTIPAGWREIPSDKANTRRFAIGDGDSAPICAVSQWPATPMMADPLANLNRWRGQIGLPAVAAADLAKEFPEDRSGATPFTWCELKAVDAAAPGLLGAMAQTPNRIYFVKISAPGAQLEAARAGFLALCRSLTPGTSE